MAGQTDQERAAHSINATLRDYSNNLSNANTNVGNRWAGYNAFGNYDRISDQINKGVTGNIDLLNAVTNRNLANTNRGTAGSMASQGVTGGAILNSALSRNQINAGRQFDTSAANMLNSAESQKVGLLNRMNQNAYGAIGNAQNVDLQNVANLFRKYGLMSGMQGQMANNAQMFDNTTWLDDALAIANAGANVASAFVSPTTNIMTGG